MIVEKVLFHCKTSPDKVALSFRDQEMTYRELGNQIIDITEAGSLELIHKSRHPFETIVAFLKAAYLKRGIIIVNKDFDNFDFELNQPPQKKFSFGILTSGSTGKPRVIWKTNDNWESAFEHQSKIFGIGQADQLLVLDSLAYSANLNSAIHALWCGASVRFEELTNAKNWGNTIKDIGVSSIFLVPSHWALLVNNKRIFEGVSSCLSCGEKLNSSTARSILDTFPNTKLTEYYGAAELGHISYQQNEEIIEKPFSVGKVFPEVHISISDQIIKVKSPYIAPDFIKEGTVGDMGSVEADGSLVLLGRLGRMFNKRGLNVYAQEIEQAILSHHKLDAAVLREVVKSGQRKLELVYSLKKDIDHIHEKELWDLLHQKIEKAKHPHFLKKVSQLPRTSFGKIAIGQLSKKLDEEAAPQC